MKDTRKFNPLNCIYFDIAAFSTVVAFNRFPERASIHTVAFHRLALVGHGNNLGGFSQYDHFIADNTLKMFKSIKKLGID